MQWIQSALCAIAVSGCATTEPVAAEASLPEPAEPVAAEASLPEPEPVATEAHPAASAEPVASEASPPASGHRTFLSALSHGGLDKDALSRAFDFHDAPPDETDPARSARSAQPGRPEQAPPPAASTPKPVGESGFRLGFLRAVSSVSPAYQDGVAKAFKRRWSAIVACYEEALRKDPAVTGHGRAQLVIGTDGFVDAFTPAFDAPTAAPVAACIGVKLGRWRFEAPPSPATFEVGFESAPAP